MQPRPHTSQRDIDNYFLFHRSGLHAADHGLTQMTFGEYLITHGAITREELFRALQLQDQNPGVRVGECLAKLGAITYAEVETFLADWSSVGIVEA